jgi:hypothetical protein
MIDSMKTGKAMRNPPFTQVMELKIRVNSPFIGDADPCQAYGGGIVGQHSQVCNKKGDHDNFMPILDWVVTGNRRRVSISPSFIQNVYVAQQRPKQ